MKTCKLQLEEEKAKTCGVGLAQKNGSGSAVLLTLLRLVKGHSKP
jgi:hypothetical protein